MIVETAQAKRRSPRGPRKGQGGRPRVVAGPIVHDAVRVPALRRGEPEAAPLLPGYRVWPMVARSLPPKRAAELLRTEARRLRIAQQFRRCRDLAEVAQKLGLSRTLVSRLWIEVVSELGRPPQADAGLLRLDKSQQELLADREKLQDIADRFHAGWTLASVARDVRLTRRMVVLGLSIILGRLRRKTLGYAALASLGLEERMRELQRALWDAWETSLKPRQTSRTKRGRDGKDVVVVTEELNPIGNVSLLNQLLKLQEREARLLGVIGAPARRRGSLEAPQAPQPSPGAAVPRPKPVPPRRVPPKAPPRVETPVPPPPAPPKLTRTVYPSAHGSMEVVTDETGRVVAIHHWRRI
jgi:AraC-like DNA-binding protein